MFVFLVHDDRTKKLPRCLHHELAGPSREAVPLDALVPLTNGLQLTRPVSVFSVTPETANSGPETPSGLLIHPRPATLTA